ncbi:hypothetical protein AJ79_08894 [Helicocarpus griseus UAMH5409]|uniref:Uncharacterized protein n=1 Tax=Helicocarpus griseus UAMH5409 TaxID=1447875 RepID=A0A2B7WP69_9EURO|nr:hypothetical protein AJ79_08894 [Helicocarpus griseus UAMH5409]
MAILKRRFAAPLWNERVKYRVTLTKSVIILLAWISDWISIVDEREYAPGIIPCSEEIETFLIADRRIDAIYADRVELVHGVENCSFLCMALDFERHYTTVKPKTTEIHGPKSGIFGILEDIRSTESLALRHAIVIK